MDTTDDGVGSSVKGTVCVTGASGFCGSWLVMRLLRQGYRVRATVRDPENKDKTSWLRSLPGAVESLDILKGDLLQENDFDAAVAGCDGVFHVASPVFFHCNDAQKELIEPAVQGALNVLKSCAKSPSIRRVIFVSSLAAVIYPKHRLEPDVVYDESCWTSVEICETQKMHGWAYMVSKTLAEQTAFEFAKKKNIDLVSINPAVVVGPFLTPEVPKTVALALSVVTGEKIYFDFMNWVSYVHVDDLARALIYLYENPAAQGRYICCKTQASIREVVEIIARRHPHLNVVKEFGDLGMPDLYSLAPQRLMKLGFEYKYSLEDMLDDALRCCMKKGLLFNNNMH